MSKYKQAIQISNDVTGIMKLPCIFSCHKEEGGSLVYLLYKWNGLGMYEKAHIGDWLCEDYNGEWFVVSDGEYRIQEGKEC